MNLFGLAHEHLDLEEILDSHVISTRIYKEYQVNLWNFPKNDGIKTASDLRMNILKLLEKFKWITCETKDEWLLKNWTIF